ncbi:MAG: PKD domain-containing protein, partial [Thermoplasmata archaeon]|nr:PKD domain-containing protein [Thermoplasmata archaeon]
MVCEKYRKNCIELISILTVFILLVAFMLPFFNGLAQPLPNNPPVADAGSDKNGYSGQWVYFFGNGTDIDGDPLQYRWFFGDGNSTGWSGNSSAQHIFGSAGNYTVTLNVTDGTL